MLTYGKGWGSEGRVLMHLANDYIHLYRAFRSSYSQCRIRIYVPDEKADAAVVVYLQLPTNPGTSTTNAARIIAGECTALPKASAPLP